MKLAADFRALARNALCGKWAIAAWTGFLAALMGATTSISGGSGSGSNSNGELFQEFQTTDFWMHFRSILIAVAVVLVVWTIVTIIIGGAAKLGYSVFNLKLVDHREVSVSDLFSQFHRLGAGFCMNFLIGLFTVLWSLLLVIPGIIKQFSYAMTPYILAENPGMTAREAITESRRMMYGNKWRLFCLEFSFIGWAILCSAPTFFAVWILTGIAVRGGSLETLLWAIPCGIPSFIGYLFLRPYREAAYAAFYRDVSAPPVPSFTEDFVTRSET